MKYDLPKTTRGSDDSWPTWLDAMMNEYDLKSSSLVQELSKARAKAKLREPGEDSYIRALRSGATRASHKVAFEMGEAIHALGVEWCSGIVSLRAEPMYVGWLFPIAGWISEEIPVDAVRKPWNVISLLLYENQATRPFDAKKWMRGYMKSARAKLVDLEEKLRLSDDERAIVAEAFTKSLKGGSSWFPEPFVAGIRMAETRPTTDDGRDMLDTVAGWCGGWMQTMDERWGKYGPWLLELKN